MNRYIFGAKAIAAGLYQAMNTLEPDKGICSFLVSDEKENVPEIRSCPVRSVVAVADELSDEERAEAQVYVAVPETLHEEVRELLIKHGFRNLILLDSHAEAEIMERYFQAIGRFPSVHSLEAIAEEPYRVPKLTVYAASFYKDKPLTRPPVFPSYVKRLYLGCEKAKQQGIVIPDQADFYDNTGDNISEKNPNRCEMTAHYWVWKNRLHTEDEYVGVCHYRRMLDLSEPDLVKMKQNDVDVVLPFPMIHDPNCRVQHTWYVPEQDWELLMQVVAELYPDYASQMEQIFDSPYFYNYNIFVAKKEIFAAYCAWLYPILDLIEERSEPKGTERADRYTAYMSESLTTLFFMARQKDFNIYHTGRLLYI